MIAAALLAGSLVGVAAAQDRSIQAAPNSRVALVIGNSAYQHATPIEKATKDAAAMADSLTRLGFAVNSLTDADYDKTHRALLGFAQSARGASMAIVYFAGYGVEANGENYLVPVEADLETDVEIGTIALRNLMSAVAEAKELGLVILEAGGGKSLGSFTSSAPASARTHRERGLARVESVQDNILVAFAARPGTTTVDREGSLSVFTEALLNNIEQPGLEIQYLFRNVEADVRDATDQQQEAAHYGSLSEKEIFLKPAEGSANAMQLAAAGEPASATNSEEIAWLFLRDSTDVASLRKFVERFPDGLHRAEANALIARLDQPKAAAAPAAAEVAWSILKERPTAAGLERFRSAYRDSPHAQDALALLTDITQRQQTPKAQQSAPDRQLLATRPVEKRRIVQRISRNDPNVEQAWQLVRTSRDPVVLRKFAADFPSRQYVSASHTRLAELGLDSRPRPARLSPSEAVAYSIAQCDRLAGGDLAGVSRDAVDACRQALTAHPEIARLQFQLCQCLIKDGRRQEASGHCEAATQMAEAKGDQTLASQSRSIQSALLVTDGDSASANLTSAVDGAAGAITTTVTGVDIATGAGASTSGMDDPVKSEIKRGGRGGHGAGGGSSLGSKSVTTLYSNEHAFSHRSFRHSTGTRLGHFRVTSFQSTHVNVTTPTVHTTTVTTHVPTVRTPTVRVPNIRVPTVNVH